MARAQRKKGIKYYVDSASLKFWFTMNITTNKIMKYGANWISHEDSKNNTGCTYRRWWWVNKNVQYSSKTEK